RPRGRRLSAGKGAARREPAGTSRTGGLTPRRSRICNTGAHMLISASMLAGCAALLLGGPVRHATLDLIGVATRAPLLNDLGPPEQGHGLSAAEAAAGWLSLFDGATTFGWAGARVEGGRLAGGTTNTEFGPAELRATIDHDGTLVIGRERVKVTPGEFTFTHKGGRGPIRLEDGAAVRTLL